CFAIGGLIGDWASVAALEAIRQRRAYAVWTDRVEHVVIKREHLNQRGVKRLYHQLRNFGLIAPLMRRVERHIIQRAGLGLFHGRDTFDAYSPWCRVPHLVHNIHLKPEDRIDAAQLARKLTRIRAGEPLRLIYSGRVAAMKGPTDWVAVMAELRAREIPFTAEWLGDGPLFGETHIVIARQELEGQVRLAGHVAEKETLMGKLHAADLFVFCHKTPESPRCLIEALMAGCPIVGYDSAYPRDLLESEADRLLTPTDNVLQLADRIASLHANRHLLAERIERVAKIGSRYSDTAVFAHRSALIKQHLGTTDNRDPKLGLLSTFPR
ncbi:MAG: glycosyltransferase, partial [Thiotrichales bacterium]